MTIYIMIELCYMYSSGQFVQLMNGCKCQILHQFVQLVNGVKGQMTLVNPGLEHLVDFFLVVVAHIDIVLFRKHFSHE